METVVVRTTVHAEPGEVFSLLRSFTDYATYSPYLADVTRHGDGDVGTEYTLTAEWWRIEYRARTEVTAIEPPEHIAWRVVDVVDAEGDWDVEATDDGTSVTLRIRFDPDSADTGAIQLPRFVSVGWIVERVKPLVRREAEATVERIVADLEGEPRDVDLTIEVRRDD